MLIMIFGPHFTACRRPNMHDHDVDLTNGSSRRHDFASLARGYSGMTGSPLIAPAPPITMQPAAAPAIVPPPGMAVPIDAPYPAPSTQPTTPWMTMSRTS